MKILHKVGIKSFPFLFSSLLFSLLVTSALVVNAQVTENLKITITPSASSFTLGKPISFKLTAVNVAQKAVKYTRYLNLNCELLTPYALTCTDSQGKAVRDPMFNIMGSYDGPVEEVKLAPGEKLEAQLDLNNYAVITKPGTYSVQGVWRLEDVRRAFTSTSIKINVAAPSDLSSYVKSLLQDLSATAGDRTNIIQKLIYTNDPAVISPLVDAMYSGRDSYWLCEALSSYLPQDKVLPVALKNAKAKGLAPDMLALMSRLDNPKGSISKNDWVQIINRSLAPDNQICWQDGCLAAPNYPDDSYVPRLIAIAETPKCNARSTAIFSLAGNRTDEGVRELKKLLQSPDIYVKSAAEQAIKSGYMHPPDDGTRPLLPSDFDRSYQTEGLEIRKLMERH
jgi:hypothetical protein